LWYDWRAACKPMLGKLPIVKRRDLPSHLYRY
jgi:hypothetical protein